MWGRNHARDLHVASGVERRLERRSERRTSHQRLRWSRSPERRQRGPEGHSDRSSERNRHDCERRHCRHQRQLRQQREHSDRRRSRSRDQRSSWQRRISHSTCRR